MKSMGHISLVIEHSTTIRLHCFFFFFPSWNYIGSHGIHILFETNPSVSHNQCWISIHNDLPGIICDNTQRSLKGENVLTFQMWRVNVLYYRMHLGTGFHKSLVRVKFHWGQGWKRKHAIIQNIQDFFSNSWFSI